MAEFANVEKSENVEMEEENDPNISVEDSSESSEDDDDDREISQLLEEINGNPFRYDAHLKLITLLRQAGELEKLRKARQNMSELFPLTGELWMQWIQDELKLMDGEEERGKVMELFDRAVKDYLVVEVWLEYCQFCVGGIGTPQGVANARRVFEEAIMAAGLHIAQGSMIWEVYREFENALLSTMQPKPGAIPTPEQQKELKDQMARISSIFKRQLAIPLLDMEQTFCEYEQWTSDLGEEMPGHVKEAYGKALDMMDNYRPLEESLLIADAPKLTEFLAYIEFELKQGNPARIQCIYERALAENCLNMSLWKEYTSYLDDNLKMSSVVLPNYERASRNCPWCLALWQGYLVALERYGEPFSTVQSVFEKALVAGFSTGADYLQLWQTYVDYLRRRIDWEGEHEEELDTFRNTVERAIVYQAQYFDAEGDPASSLQQYLAFVEAKYCQNAMRMRELWNDIMSTGHGGQAQMWLQYIHMERCYGDTKHVRKVFHRAIHSVSDWPETVFEAFLNFEREEGTLDTWSSAVKRVETQMKRVTEQRTRAAEQEAMWSQQSGERREGHRHKDRSERRGGKRSYDEPGTSKQPFKKQKNFHRESNDRGRTRFEDQAGPSSSQSSSWTSSPSTSASSSTSAAETSLPTSGTVFKVPQLPGSKEGAAEEDSRDAAERVKDVEMEENNTAQDAAAAQKSEAKKKRAEHNARMDGKTIFVKNLDYNVTADQLREAFSTCGTIADVRMVTNYQKKFKGFCYVEFADEESAKKALTKDRELLNNRPMYVDPSKDTTQQPTEKKFKYENKMEKSKLFVSGLPRSLTKEDLETRFTEYGKVKEVRIVTYKSGISKGLAYVEFEEEACASKAVMSLDNTQIGEHTISVAISNPPTRKAPLKNAPPLSTPREAGKKSLGAKGIVGPRGKGRTQVSLLPRSLQRPRASPSAPAKAKPSSTPVAMETSEAASNGDGKADVEAIQKPKMSNADFANLFKK